MFLFIFQINMNVSYKFKQIFSNAEVILKVSTNIYYFLYPMVRNVNLDNTVCIWTGIIGLVMCFCFIF